MTMNKLPTYHSKQLVKHKPLRPYTQTESDHTVYVKSKTPFISAVKRINKILSKYETIPNKRGKYVSKGNVSGNIEYITVMGMGKSIEKTVNIGVYFKFDLDFKVDIITKSVGVLDEFRPNGDDDGDDSDEILRKRNVGGVEVRIYLKS